MTNIRPWLFIRGYRLTITDTSGNKLTFSPSDTSITLKNRKLIMEQFRTILQTPGLIAPGDLRLAQEIIYSCDPSSTIVLDPLVKRPPRHRNLGLYIFAGILISFVAISATWALITGYSKCQKLLNEGRETTATVDYIRLFASGQTPTTSIQDATAIGIQVEYTINSNHYSKYIDTAMDTSLYNEASSHYLRIRYLPDDPTNVEAAMNFTTSTPCSILNPSKL